MTRAGQSVRGSPEFSNHGALTMCLMQALKGSNEDDVDATLDRVMMLFRYLQEKDVFEKYYKQHLAKRLLSGRAVRSPH